jgi:DNA topoisomerase IB
MARLRKADPSSPGFTRRGRGRGFEYLDADGIRISDPVVLDRIRALAIPPAWRDVWICPDDRGHLQATGTDAAGRRQYLYHEAWRAHRDREKFEHVLDLAERLPDVREVVRDELNLSGVPRERALAGAVRLLDRGAFRIGSEQYTEENGSFGLATIRKDHVTIRDGRIRFDYTAKGGKRRLLTISDDQLVPLIRTLKRRRSGGEELLAYRTRRAWHDVTSTDVNDHLKELFDDPDASAKDFRTWHATVLATVGIAGHPLGGPTAQRRAISATIKDVAGSLGNTPAVCRASYIDPRVWDRYAQGETVADRIRLTEVHPDDHGSLHELEAAVVALLRGDAGSVTETRRAA